MKTESVQIYDLCANKLFVLKLIVIETLSLKSKG
jgi:hypothetical protein